MDPFYSELFSLLPLEPDLNYTIRLRLYGQSKNIFSRMLVVNGHQYLFNLKIQKDEIIETVKKYSLYSWLDLLSKLESIVLLSPNRENERSIIVRQVFPQAVFSRIERKKDREQDEKDILICRAQIILLKKIALKFCGLDNQADVYRMLKTPELSKVFLGVNDFVNEEDSGLGAEENPNFSKWIEYATRNQYLNNVPDLAHLVFRAIKMFKELPCKVGTFRDEKNFEDYFYSITGIKIEEFMAVGIALYFHFLQKIDNILKLGSLIDIDTYFKSSGLSKDVIEKIIKQSALPYDQVVKDFDDVTKKLTDPETYSAGNFTRKPVIELPDGRLLIADQVSFILKHTLNLPWLLVESMPTDNNIVNDITGHRGLLFEEYSHMLLEKIATLGEIIYKRIMPMQNEKLCDGVLIKGNNIFLFEMKSLQTSEGFKTLGHNSKQESEVNERLLREAGEQLANTIKLIKEGRIESIPRDITYTFFPIVLTYEDIPTDFKIIRGYRDFLHEQKIIMQTGDIRALEIMSAEELELMYDHAPIADICDLYVRKHSTDPHAQEASFKNFFFAVGTEQHMPTRLRDEFLELAKKYINPTLFK